MASSSPVDHWRRRIVPALPGLVSSDLPSVRQAPSAQRRRMRTLPSATGWVKVTVWSISVSAFAPVSSKVAVTRLSPIGKVNSCVPAVFHFALVEVIYRPVFGGRSGSAHAAAEIDGGSGREVLHRDDEFHVVLGPDLLDGIVSLAVAADDELGGVVGCLGDVVPLPVGGCSGGLVGEDLPARGPAGDCLWRLARP